jgi:AsmA protein
MRGLVRLILGVVTLVVLAFGAVALIPAERVAGLAAAEFQKVTGRVLSIEGSVRASIWPVLGVTMGDVLLSNADWSEAGPMLTADRMAMGLSLSALMRGEVHITTVKADGARLVLERAADGRTNWDFAAAQAGAAPVAEGAAPTPFAVETARMEDASLVWIDHASGTRVEVTEIALDLRAPDPAGAARIDLSASAGGLPFRVEASVDDFAAALSGKVVALTASAASGAASVRFDGQAGHSPLAAEGRVTGDLGDAQVMAALTGAVVLPEGLGARERKLEGRLTVAPEGSLHLREGVVTLDGNVLQIAADVTFDGPRPRIVAQIDTGMLQLPGLAGRTQAAPSPQDAGWPRGTIDVAALGLADAEIALRAEGMAAGPVTLGRTRATVTLDRARAVFTLREVQAWGGALGGEFVVNGRGGLSVGGDLTARGIAVHSLLGEAAGYDRLTGTGNARLKFLGAGNSVAAVMATLSGEGAVSLGKGELRGLDLLGMLRTLDPSFVGEGQKTIFDAVAATFAIADGVLRNDDLKLTAPYLMATGAGTVGLGAQVIDYRVTPTALTKADGTGGVRVPLQITGPWSAPRYGLDLKALAEQELADERARLEAAAEEAVEKARADLEAQAQEELGIVPLEGESLEDAARRRAEEALRDGTTEALQGILGGN